jgi:hypothetical protein
MSRLSNARVCTRYRTPRLQGQISLPCAEEREEGRAVALPVGFPYVDPHPITAFGGAVLYPGGRALGHQLVEGIGVAVAH